MKVVFYTDGSVRPTNPGYGGYGIFGYVFKNAPRPKNTKHPVKDKLSFTDQGISDKKSNTPIEVTHVLEYVRAVNNPQCTNNDNEIKATLHALEYIHSHPELTSALILTDSEYVVKSFSDSLDKWLVNGFKRMDGKQIVHVDDWATVDVYRKAIRERGTELKIEWVKAHNDDYGNDMADLLSVIGATASRYQFENSVKEFQTDVHSSELTYAEYKKSYQNKDFIYHFKDLFFSSANIDDASYCFISSSEDDKEIGKRDNTSIFLASHGHVPEFINNLKRFYRQQPRQYVATCSIKLSRLENRDLLRLGDYIPAEYLVAPISRSSRRGFALVGGSGTSSLVFMQENTMEFPFIASVTKINELLSQPDLTGISKLQVWDVTPRFVQEGKLALSNKDKFVDFTYLTEGRLVLTQRLIASVGADIPSYLSLKKIEGEIEKAEVILQGSPNNNLYTLYVRITTGDRQMYSLNVVNKYLAVAVHP